MSKLSALIAAMLVMSSSAFADFAVTFYWDASIPNARLWVNDGIGWQRIHQIDYGPITVGVVSVTCPTTTWGGWQIFIGTESALDGYSGIGAGGELLSFAGDGHYSSWEYFSNSQGDADYYGEFNDESWVPLDTPAIWQAGDPYAIAAPTATIKSKRGRGHTK